MQSQDSVSQEDKSGQETLAALFAKKSAGKWKCSKCYVFNENERQTCKFCDSEKPSAEPNAHANTVSSEQKTVQPISSNSTKTSNMFANLVHSGPSAFSFPTLKGPITFGGKSTTINPSETKQTTETTTPSKGFVFPTLKNTTFSFGGKTIDIQEGKNKDIEDTTQKRSIETSSVQENKKVLLNSTVSSESTTTTTTTATTTIDTNQQKIQDKTIKVNKQDIINNESVSIPDNRKDIYPKDSITQYMPLRSTEYTKTKVFIWGSGECGQLGLGDDISDSTHPICLEALNSKNIVRLCAGGMHTLAISNNKKHTIYSWGANDEHVLGREGEEFEPEEVDLKNLNKNETITQLFAGQCHSVLLSNQEKVYTWGIYRNSSGYMKWNVDIRSQPIPKEIDSFPTIGTHNFKDVIIQVACGDNHTMALGKSGYVYSWGCDEQGQTSHYVCSKRESNYYTPYPITVKEGRSTSHIIGVYCGSMHSILLSSTHAIFTTGLNNYGQLGNGTRKDQRTFKQLRYMSNKNIVAIDAGQHHTLALSEDGTVYCCGRNHYGQLGLKESDIDGEVLFRKIDGVDNILFQQIACGDCHSMALSTKGDVYCWGYNGLGQVGNDTYDDVLLPTKINPDYFENMRVIQISGGGQHSCCIAIPRDKNDMN